MKNRISVKKGTSIYLEKRAIGVLFFCTVVSIIIAAVIEFDLVKYVNCQWCFINFQKHKDFFVNIALGLSASGIISYLSLKIPYLMKKKDEIISLEKKACDLYLSYQNVCSLLLYNKNIFMLNKRIRNLVKEWSDEDKKNILKESIELIPKQIDEVFKHIKILQGMVKQSSFSSANINEAIDIATNKMQPSMLTLKKLIDEVPNMMKEFHISVSDEDCIYIKLMLYNVIYKELYNTYCFEEIKKVFESITNKHKMYMNSCDTINKINQKLILDIENVHQEVALITIKTKLTQILFEETTKNIKIQ